MAREIRKVRKSIKARKKTRQLNQMSHEAIPSYILTDEEKYSSYPELSYEVNKNDKKRATTFTFNNNKLSFAFINKAILSVALFIFSFFMLKTEFVTMERPKQLLLQSLQDEFPFAMVHEWYVEHLGIPLSLVPQERMVIEFPDDPLDTPITGEVVESFQTNGTGIMISPENESRIHAVNKGIVIFAGNKNGTDKTVVIQHADGSETTYGMLSTIDVHLYQIVETNQVIGTKDPSDENKAVFFSIEKENHYIDPAKVIRVDDLP